MSVVLAPIFYPVVAIATLWLAVLWGARVRPGRWRVVAVLLICAAASLLFVRVDGLPLWNRAFSFFPNPSLPLLGIVFAALWQRLLGTRCLGPEDWRAVWVFGAVAGSVLYLHPMAFGGVDLYYWGWEREHATWVLAAVGVTLLAGGNRLGVIFLAALIAYAVNALESQNCWDYLMDPFYWLISLAVLGARGIYWVWNAFKRAECRPQA
jgi:hypothetical protein